MEKFEYIQRHINQTNEFIDTYKIDTPKINSYFCPICLEEINDDEFTEDHVPQECVGGNRLVLTCKNCNCSRGGANLDIYLLNYLKTFFLKNGYAGSEVVLKVTSETSGGYVKLIRGENNEMILESLKNHEGTQRMNAEFQNNYDNLLQNYIITHGRYYPDIKTWGISITEYYDNKDSFSDAITIKKAIPFYGKTNDKFALLGILKNAYLYSFHVLSYPMMFFYPIFQKIRNGIMNPEEFDLNNIFVLFNAIDSFHGIGFINKPAKLHECLIINLPYTVTYENGKKITTNIAVIIPPYDKIVNIDDNVEVEIIISPR